MFMFSGCFINNKKLHNLKHVYNDTLRCDSIFKNIDTIRESDYVPVNHKRVKAVLNNVDEVSKTKSIELESDKVFHSKNKKDSVINNYKNLFKFNKKEFKLGNIVYKIPDTMSNMKDYDIVVRIANHKDTSMIIGMGSNLVKSNIVVSSRMEVKLVDSSPDSAFNIRVINNGIQIIDSNSYTEWKFTVKPLKQGNRKINLVVSVITGQDVKQVVYTDIVYIKNNIIEETKSFWNINWKWLFTTIFIPIFIYFWNKKRKKNKNGKRD